MRDAVYPLSERAVKAAVGAALGTKERVGGSPINMGGNAELLRPITVTGAFLFIFLLLGGCIICWIYGLSEKIPRR